MSLGKTVGGGCGILILVFIALAALGSLVGTQTSSTADGDALDEVEANASAASKALDSAETTRNSTNWTYAEQKDELRNSTDHFAQIVSENTVNFSFPYSGDQHLTMTVRQSKAQGTDVFFQIEQGQFICDIYQCTGHISFDGKPESLTLVPPEDHDSTVLFAKYGPAIVQKLKTSKKMIVELQFYQEGNRQFTFNTTGFKWDH